ncbi:MAG TPA: ABC transporter permease [Candidatus Blautia stercorigallinarum]|uniref:ABC transporter permease n=1 Tax=Candidatus Blautia stercorigallinarum TaxID=2838501 RepID=A0A9D1PG02_9FIRM|nr:ABC transporter permease [Candidatus Blautia stercorigallinarum]
MSKKIFGFFNKQKQFEKEVLENNMQYSSFYGDSFKQLKKNKIAMFCAGVIIVLILIAIFAPLIAPYDPTYQDYAAVLAEPSMAHPFGTDEYGRDILSRIIYGSRVSISIGIVAQIVASLVGVTLGSIAGYYGGKIDSVISRIMEIFQAFPDLIFAMAIMTFMGKGVVNLFIALGLLTWVRTARMIRGSVMQLKEKEYIEASRASGATTYWIIMKGLIPNCLSTIIVLVTLGIPNAIMYEASLSFLGIGIVPPTPSWGNMISAAQTFINYRPLYSIMPGVAIMITVIAFNIFGDGLRDALDPKLKN